MPVKAKRSSARARAAMLGDDEVEQWCGEKGIIRSKAERERERGEWWVRDRVCEMR